MDHDVVSLVRANVTDTFVEVELSDGRRLATPLAWYPALQVASREHREQFEVSPWGLHWPALDEDLSLDGMLMGQLSSTFLSQVAREVSRPASERYKSVDTDQIGLQNGLVDFPQLRRSTDG